MCRLFCLMTGIYGLLIVGVDGLNNGLVLTPPCGLNSYMAGGSGEAFLQSIADFFVSSGMIKQCFSFVNSDEGWEISKRNATTQELMWDPNQYPSGMPAFAARLKSSGISLGLYGAASGVTCGGVSGQLGFEDLDMQTMASWGIGYWKSDNCASYAMDSSVRFAATRDAINRTGAAIVLSIEPFSISPDLRQSSKLANLWRIAQDISGNWETFTNRADISDKWAPLAGPGAWNDPDMINVGTHFTLGENRAYFGLWAIMKAPLLLSANLPALNASAPAIIAIVSNAEVVAVNQDSLGVQARKLSLDGAVLPWLVGTEACDAGPGGGLTGMRNRGWTAPTDTRAWSMVGPIVYRDKGGAWPPPRPPPPPPAPSSSTLRRAAACPMGRQWGLRLQCCSRAILRTPRRPGLSPRVCTRCLPS